MGASVNDLSRVDTDTRTIPPGYAVSGEIDVEGGAVGGLAISPDGDLLVATHYGEHSFSLIDAHSGAVVQTVVDVDEPLAVAVSSTGRAYVASASASYDSVLAFDFDADRVVETYPLACGIGDLAVSPNGRQLHVGRTGSDGASVATLDTATGGERAISLGGPGAVTESLALSRDGRRLYIAVNAASTAELVVVDTRRNRVVTAVEIGSPIRDIALSPDGGCVYVASCGPDFGAVLDVVNVRDARRCSITATYKIGDAAGVVTRMTLSRDGNLAYLVGDTGLTLLSTRSHDVIGRIATGAQPSCALDSPAGNRLYVADYAGALTVLAVDAAATSAAA